MNLQLKKFCKWWEEEYNVPCNGEGARKVARRIISNLEVNGEFLKESVRDEEYFLYLKKIAKYMGLEETEPLFHPIEETALLLYFNNQFRIVLKNKNRLPPDRKKYRSLYRRMRFSYAHELGHLLFFDIKTGKRRAPIPPNSKEEELCNAFASELVFPLNFVETDLKNILTNGSLTPEEVIMLSNQYEVSLQVALIGIEKIAHKYIPEDEFILVSHRSFPSLRDECDVKPRCLVFIASDKPQKGRRLFLPHRIGIDKIKPVPILRGKWSLMEYYYGKFLGQISPYTKREKMVKMDEIIAWPPLNRKKSYTIRLNVVTHQRIKNLPIVWTKASYEFI